MFVLGKPFQLILMLAGKAGGYPSEALASPTNFRLGWKGLPVKNTLAYYENT
jgi:hypothetical protein